MSDAGELDPDRPHPYIPPQLPRSKACAACGRSVYASIHILADSRCPDCGRALDINGDCPAGCTDERFLGPAAPPVTSRDRFGGRNR